MTCGHGVINNFNTFSITIQQIILGDTVQLMAQSLKLVPNTNDNT